MLPQEAADEAPPADFAAVLKASKRDQHFAPLRQDGLARKHFTENNSVAPEQHPANRFEGYIAIASFARIKKRPAPRTMARSRGTAVAVPGASLWVDQRAQIIEAIGGQQARRHQFPESGFHFRLQLARAAHNIGEEGSAPLPQELKHGSGIGAQAGSLSIAGLAPRNHPLRFVAREKRNRRHAARHHAPLAVAR